MAKECLSGNYKRKRYQTILRLVPTTALIGPDTKMVVQLIRSYMNGHYCIHTIMFTHSLLIQLSSGRGYVLGLKDLVLFNISRLLTDLWKLRMLQAFAS